MQPKHNYSDVTISFTNIPFNLFTTIFPTVDAVTKVSSFNFDVRLELAFHVFESLKQDEILVGASFGFASWLHETNKK